MQWGGSDKRLSLSKSSVALTGWEKCSKMYVLHNKWTDDKEILPVNDSITPLATRHLWPWLVFHCRRYQYAWGTSTSHLFYYIIVVRNLANFPKMLLSHLEFTAAWPSGEPQWEELKVIPNLFRFDQSRVSTTRRSGDHGAQAKQECPRGGSNKSVFQWLV